MRSMVAPTVCFVGIIIVVGIFCEQVLDGGFQVRAFKLLDSIHHGRRQRQHVVVDSNRLFFFNNGPVSSSSRRFALIYGMDGEEVLESATSTTTTTATVASQQQQQQQQQLEQLLPLVDVLEETLSSQVSMSTLIRIGCAFAPPPHRDTIHPGMVESASLVSIDQTKMEIALAVPSEGEGSVGGSVSLVQILVSVTVPSTVVQSSLWQHQQQQQDDDLLLLSSSLETLLLETIQQLDDRAMKIIGDSERRIVHEQNNYEEIADQQRVLQELRKEPYADEVPDWWTWPELRIGLEEECKAMKGLLNEEDFSTELISLCRIYSPSTTITTTTTTNFKEEEIDSICQFKVVQACVAAVGPSGLFLRARVEEEQALLNGVDHSRNNNNNNNYNKNYNTIDVGIAFPKEATSEDSLRTAILDLVESVEETVEEPSVVPPEPVLLESGHDDEEEEKSEVTIPAEEERVEEGLVASHEDEAVVDVEVTYEEEENSSALQEIELSTPKENPTTHDIAKAREQPKSPELQAKLASKYAAIDDVGERAYTILKDLYMI